MPDPYGFILHAHTKPDKSEAFEALFRTYIEPSRAEPGCIEYHMLRDAHDPALFIFFEIWASAEAFAAHIALPHMQRFHEQRMDYLSQDLVIRPIETLSDASASHH
ncbi:putative quinol monooxygenase [Stutzerimonas stutzeri]|uniref:putative quinol monooxygenase n=1 Tax=Stutzerimonas stutzeri TaxID=316 RepID=UPI00210A10BE|nr:putative quinol monooxygenase [Stutzerimonas stutzeri]MCQ4259601.1 antibiotic biosynthesis monooxygenase [Stutzerimonas stutzeri]